jgi:ligand-binding sensor protein
MEKTLSEAAKIFLNQLSEILIDFERESGFQVFLLNKEGQLIDELEGVQPACKMILLTKEGKIRCKDCFKMGFQMAKLKKDFLLLECYAGFAISWIPIIRNDSFVGAVVMCGKKIEERESEEKLREKVLNLAGELGIFESEEFLEKVKQTEETSEEEIKNYAERLKKLVDVLIENVQTTIKEIFG